jgi:hypothetical protein
MAGMLIGQAGAPTPLPSNPSVPAVQPIRQGLKNYYQTHQADEFFGLTNIWDFYLTISPECWKAMEPKETQAQPPSPPQGATARRAAFRYFS